MKILGKILLSLFIIIVIIAIVFVVLINLTPRQLKINNIEIMDTSIDELGLSDVKIINIIKGMKNLVKAEEKTIVSNPYNETTAQTSAEKNISGSSLDGQSNYSSIINDRVTYDKQYLLEYDDTTLAYMLNNAINNSTTPSDAIKYLKDANISLKEITINKDAATLRIIGYVQVASFIDDIKDALGSAASFVKIPSQLFLTCDFNITGVDENGLITLESKSVSVNGSSNDPVAQAVMKIIVRIAGTEEDDITTINNNVGQAFAETIANLGKIGTATINTDKEVTGNIQIGVSGIYNNKITVITYKAAA